MIRASFDGASDENRLVSRAVADSCFWETPPRGAATLGSLFLPSNLRSNAPCVLLSEEAPRCLGPMEDGSDRGRPYGCNGARTVIFLGASSPLREVRWTVQHAQILMRVGGLGLVWGCFCVRRARPRRFLISLGQHSLQQRRRIVVHIRRHNRATSKLRMAWGLCASQHTADYLKSVPIWTGLVQNWNGSLATAVASHTTPQFHVLVGLSLSC